MKITCYTSESDLKRPLVLLQDMYQGLRESRELAWRLMVRNLSAMYRQTMLGFLWAFLPPVFAAATFIILRKGGALTIDESGVAYVPWVMAGTFLWQVFSDGVTAPMRQVVQAKQMLTKINFPREALILAGIGETIVNFLVRLIILVPVLALYQVVPGWEIVWAPFLILLLIAMGNVIGILITPAAILYQDFEKGIPLLLPSLMILSGAVIPVPADGFGAKLAAFNPMYPVLESARRCLMGMPLEYSWLTLFYAICTLVLIFIGWVIYRVSIPHLIARMGM